MGAAAGILGSVFSIVGGVVGAWGAMEKGKAQAAALRYQAQVAENNKTIAEQNSKWSMAAGHFQSAAIGTKTRDAFGQTKAAQAAGGVDVNSGSALDVQTAVARTGQLDALTAEGNAAKEAYGWSAQAGNFGAQAGLLRNEADDSERLGVIDAFGSLLGGAGGAIGNWPQGGMRTQTASNRTTSTMRANGLVMT